MNDVVGNRTIGTFLEYHASTKPYRTALVTETDDGLRQSLTWAELNRLANQSANWLLQQGLDHGDALALGLPNCLEAVLLWLAAAKSRMVAVPFDPRSTVPEIRHFLDYCDARLVVSHGSIAATVKSASRNCSTIKRLVTISLQEPFTTSAMGKEIQAHGPDPPQASAKTEDLLAILYTSGTTSAPKGVMLTHSAYLYGAEVFARSTALTSTDRHLVCLPLYHAAAQCHAFGPSLVAGSSAVIVERFSASRFLEQAIRYNATRSALFAAPLRMLLRHFADAAPPQTPLSLVTFAQNLSSEELAEWERKFQIPLMQLWGMTETVGLPLMTPLHGPRDNMCMGMPVVGYRVRVVNESGSELPPGVPGEIVVRAEPGSNVSLGYFKNPQATAELFRDGWLRSGDRAVRDERGYFHFLGRFKDVIKRAGENISPAEVEGVLKAHPAVIDAVVFGVPDTIRDERVIAYVIFRTNRSAEPQELKDWCQPRLSSFKVPEEFRICTEFPRNSVGKVQRHLLRRAYLDTALEL